MAKDPGFIYLIHAVGTHRYKIGYARDLKRRLADLATASPFELKLIASREGTTDTERQMHIYFREFRVTGEWFRFRSRAFIERQFKNWVPIWTEYSEYESTDEDQRRCSELLSQIMNGTMRADVSLQALPR